MKISVVVPAFNERERIGAVLEPIVSCSFVQQVLVVDDGSTDGTDHVVRQFPVDCIRWKENRGKAAAVWAGLKRVRDPVVVLLDADLRGLRPDHIVQMAEPAFENRADMVIGVFRGGRFWTDLSHMFAPWVSGQRAFRKETLEELPDLSRLGYGLEAALNKLARERGWRTQSVVLRGVSHVMKEEKVGLIRGLTERGRMYWEVGKGWLLSLNGRSPEEDRDP